MPDTSSILVNIDNYIVAETSKHFANTVRFARGVNRFSHARQLIPIAKQSIERMNRDTIYRSAVVNISQGASVTVPDAGERYMSVVVIDENNYTTAIWHNSGTYPLSVAEHGSDFVAVLVRILVDPADPADIAIAHELQRGVGVEAIAGAEYQRPNFDHASHQVVHNLLKQLGEGMTDATACNGTRLEVSPIRHMVSAAFGWGGLPTKEVVYVNDTTQRPLDHHQLTVKDVPVDGFWSISIYNQTGFFEQNAYESYSMNSIFAIPNVDGSYTLNFGSTPEVGQNFLYIMPGWSYVVRLYQPHAAVISGTWRFPVPVLASP